MRVLSLGAATPGGNPAQNVSLGRATHPRLPDPTPKPDPAAGSQHEYRSTLMNGLGNPESRQSTHSAGIHGHAIAVRSEHVDSPRVPSKSRPGKQSAPVPPVPKKTQRIIRLGVAFALVCAAAMSAPTLFNLAELVGFKRNLAWLLPACLDGYAGTSILFGSKVPASHPARNAATKNARLALGLTVFANGGYHLLTLAGTMVPHWVSTALLVTVSSLPPFIVHRLLHLHHLADGTGAEAPTTAAQVPTERRQVEVPTKVPTADRVPTAPTRVPIQVPTATVNGTPVGTDKTADIIDLSAAGDAVRRSTADWVALALPLYRSHADSFGRPPTAPELATLLAEHGHGTLKPSRARDIRLATEKTETTGPADVEPERELIGAGR